MLSTPNEIAQYIDSFKHFYAATSTSLIFLSSPKLPQLLLEYGMDPGSTIQLGRVDGSSYEGVDVYASMAHFRSEPGFNREYLGMQMMTAISFVNDAIERLALKRTPELHFLRHVRNGISHGNQFHFRGKELKEPAHFKAFHLTIVDQGTPVLFHYLLPGDVFDLLEHVADYLRSHPDAGNPR